MEYSLRGPRTYQEGVSGNTSTSSRGHPAVLGQRGQTQACLNPRPGCSQSPGVYRAKLGCRVQAPRAAIPPRRGEGQSCFGCRGPLLTWCSWGDRTWATGRLSRGRPGTPPEELESLLQGWKQLLEPCCILGCLGGRQRPTLRLVSQSRAALVEMRVRTSKEAVSWPEGNPTSKSSGLPHPTS